MSQPVRARDRYSVEELAVAIVSEVIGATIFAWVIGNLVNLVLNLDPAERNRKSMMSYLKEYMRELPLSLRAKKSISKNYAFHLQVKAIARVFFPARNKTFTSSGGLIRVP